MSRWRIEDLGIAGYGEANLDGGGLNMVRHPGTGEEFAVLPMLEHAFVLIDPRRRLGRHILPDMSVFQRTSRRTVQGPDGALYSVGFRRGCVYERTQTCALLRWDWQSPRSEPCLDFELPADTCAGLEFDSEGRLYVCVGGRLSRLDLSTGRLERVADGVVDFAAGRDEPWLYTVAGGLVCAMDPADPVPRPVTLPGGQPCPAGRLERDGGGRLIIAADVGCRGGATLWAELKGGRAEPVEAHALRLADTLICNVEVAQADPASVYRSPFAFDDGSVISRVAGTEVTVVDSAGRWQTFAFARREQPLQLFSMEIGGGRIWLGTVLPLHLLSYDFATGRFANHGITAPVPGEIYNMVWSGGRLFMASYPGAFVTRLDPARPLRPDASAQANPRQFGRIKDLPLPLHRTHGRACDPAGNVYFAAKGDYGCEDSGICRIDIETESVTRWIYPATTMTALTFLPQEGRLLVCERRKGEPDLRLTFVDPATGSIAESLPVIRDRGDIVAWLHDGGDLVYGLHDYRATLFAFSLRERRIVARLEELGFGHHCQNSLVAGPDGRIWGLTRECVFAVDRELRAKERLATFEDMMLLPHSRFGMGFGPDGALYFMNGAHLMRMAASGAAR